MIKILIVDDNPLKAKKVVEVLNTVGGCTYDLAADLVTSRNQLQKYFDLLILDINLPERFSETPIANKGLEFISEIRSSKRLKSPAHIIGLTEYDEIISTYKDEFQDKLLSVIKYDEKGTAWKKQLITKVEDLINTEVQKLSSSENDFDVAIITALRTPELEEVLNLDYQWKQLNIPNDFSNYFIGKLNIAGNQNINVIATSLPQMGMVATSVSVMKVLNNFKPKYIIMTGICAGIKGKVQLGDLVISDMSFDSGSGKISADHTGEEKFEPDFKSIPLAGDLKQQFIELSMNKNVLRTIKDLWKGNSVTNELVLHLGPVGSGAGVIANADYVEKIRSFQRKLTAIDMETYAIFYCAHYANNPKPTAISIKGVSDFADDHKNDDIQKYCSFTSARVADYIIKNVLTF